MKHIVIVGGGTAGWMAAIAIASRFPDKRVTVVDSTTMGPIGVGESVTGVVHEFVADPLHGLSLGELFRRCDATFKMGLWYRDWQGVGTEYLNPIDFTPRYLPHNYETVSEDFYASVAAESEPLGEMQIFGRLMRQNRTDHFRKPNDQVNTEMAAASCHFDSLKFAAWLQEIAGQRANIRHYDDIVERFDRDAETGDVTAVHTRDGREISGDLYLDCTGFHRLFFAKVWQPKWKSYADHIKVDSAIPQLQPYAEGQVMPSYTKATAMPNGWMWKIPTQSRLGRGYIFSSRYVSDEQAITEFRAAGVPVGDTPRILRFQAGRYEQLWIGNVCSVGLSGVFSEPLESTTIHGMSVQIKLLTELLLPFCTRESMSLMAEQYNRLMGVAYDDYVDFISFHYHAGRTDTEFWRDYQRLESITPANQARMEKWKHAFPCREDFSPIHTQLAKLNTGLVVWAPMLAGMGYFRPEHARRVIQLTRHENAMKENMARYLRIRDYIVPRALKQSEAIAHFRQMP